MTDRITQRAGKVIILSVDHEHQVMQFDYAEDLADFVAELVRVGQKTFPECHYIDPQIDTDYGMIARISARLGIRPYAKMRDMLQWVWGIQKSKLMVERNDSAGIEK